ncbi:MAG: molybdopterin-dependent oxidoreductase [Chloroflexi bacterium]|nr:molybdopterin-dependent oxidoreductase [Chloroflexota bacterium]
MSEKVIGRPVARMDARAKVTGEALYPADFGRPDMLHAKLLFSGRPHARITAIDVSTAEAMPGVVAILTAKDVPYNAYGLQTPDQPVLCGPGSTQPGADVVRWLGDQVALVVAETPRDAARARDAIHVTYDDLPIVTDPFQAIDSGAPQLHPDRRPSESHPELCIDGNRISHHQVRKGDLALGFASADVIVEADYQTPSQEHAYLQPEAGLATIDEEGRVAVIVGGQWAWEDQRQIALALGIPTDRVRVIYPAIGGAFGGREDMSVQIVLALAAMRLQRPVKLVWTREESILGHCKRHPMWVHCKWGATRDGRIVAAEVRAVADGGAYCYTSNKVMGNFSLTCTGQYDIPNVAVDVDSYYTNNPPAGAFRGFGAPQGIFVAEMQVNKLSDALGIDPVELRVRNLLRDDVPSVTGAPLPGGVSLVEVTKRCAEAAGWQHNGERWRRPERNAADATSPLRRGIGLATGFKNAGFSFGYRDNCWAKVELEGKSQIELATISIGSAEVGQGSHTAIMQMAAEALGIPLDRLQLVAADTATSPGSSGSVSASRMTFMAGNAIRGAAAAAFERWAAGERPATADYTYLAPPTTPVDLDAGQGSPNFAYGYVSEAVEVEVDTETGQLQVLRAVCVDDVGRAVNPQSIEGQIEGAIAQALGWATCESFIVKDGHVLTEHLSTYLIPTISDVALRVESIIVEHRDPNGPWGVRGVGEMPFLPLAPALAAALHDATGVWFDRLPLTPERVLWGLQDRTAESE